MEHQIHKLILFLMESKYENEERPDDGDNSNTARIIKMNDIVHGTIQNLDDKDWFRLEGRGNGQDGTLYIEVDGGNTGVERFGEAVTTIEKFSKFSLQTKHLLSDF